MPIHPQKIVYWLFISVLLALCLLSSSFAEGALPSIEQNESQVGYVSPQTLEPVLSRDGKALFNAWQPRVLLAGPYPSAVPVRISAPHAVRAPADPLRTETARASFTITYMAAGEKDRAGETCSTFPEEARGVFTSAAAIWSRLLQSSVPITIQACWANLQGTVLGYSGAPNQYRDFQHAPVANTWYQSSLANALHGSSLHGEGSTGFDMHITYNSNYSWYFGTDGNTPDDKFDLFSVVLHEIAHGLNFAGTMNYSNGWAGWGYDTNMPNIYDRFVFSYSQSCDRWAYLVDTSCYSNPSTTLGSAVKSNNIWWAGENAKAANSDTFVKIFAPSTWMPGSSYAHLDAETFRNTVHRLMIWYINPGDSIHDPGAVTLGMFKDMGWRISDATQHIITVSASPAAGGTVTGGGTYNADASVTVSATANTGYTFVNWTEAGVQVSANAGYTFTVTGDRTLVANFAAQGVDTYTISVSASPAAGGTVTGGGIFVDGASVTVTATANSGYDFVNWTEAPAPAALPGTQARTSRGMSMRSDSRVVLLADPEPRPNRIRIPAPQKLVTPSTATATFEIVYVADGGTDPWGERCYDFPVAAKAAVDRAAVIWGNILRSSVPITVQACWISKEGTVLGYSGGSPIHGNFLNAPRENTWYKGSLANSLAGEDLNPDRYDMYIAMNGNFSWYHGLDATPPAGQYDFVSVMLHEIGHGLNFSGMLAYADGTAQWGQSGYPSTYEIYMRDGAGNELLNTAIYPNPSTALGSLATSNDLWFHGPNAMAANGGQRVKMYAPSTWSGGSSYSHLDTPTFRDGPNRLMVHAIGAGDAIHDPGPITTGLLKDLGWRLNEGTDEYTVAVSANPVAGGSVSGGGTFADGTNVTVTATANTGYQFLNWTEGGTVVSSSASFTFTADRNRTLTANFSRVVSTNPSFTFTADRNRTLVANFAAQGGDSYTISVSSSPAAGGAVAGGGTYDAGTGVTVSATANTGYTFVNWTEAGVQVSANANYTFTVTGNRTLVANFATQGGDSYTISVSASPAAYGTVTGGGTYDAGAGVTVSATAISGYQFASWTEGGTQVSANSAYTFTAQRNRTLTANFTTVSGDPFTITVVASPADGSGGSVSGGGPYTHGQVATLTATPNAPLGWQFVNWTEGGYAGSTSTNYSFPVTGNRTLTANFTQVEAIPTLSEWGVIALTGLLLVVGAVQLRRWSRTLRHQF